MDRLDEFLHRISLQHVAGDSLSQHRLHAGSILVGGKRQQSGLGMADPDLPSGLWPASLRHRHVENGHVGGLRVGHQDGLVRVLGDADQLQGGLLVDEVGQGLTNLRFVVGDQDSDWSLAAPGGRGRSREEFSVARLAGWECHGGITRMIGISD